LWEAADARGSSVVSSIGGKLTMTLGFRAPGNPWFHFRSCHRPSPDKLPSFRCSAQTFSTLWARWALVSLPFCVQLNRSLPRWGVIPWDLLQQSGKLAQLSGTKYSLQFRITFPIRRRDSRVCFVIESVFAIVGER
jgi:hypothetical protein